jgi:CDP-diacylglycerol---glycerol-3-phosphate 3-phosphatidyltransferase
LSNQDVIRPLAKLTLTRLRGSLGHSLTRPMVPLLVRLGLKPNALTLMGLGLSLVVAAVVALDWFLLGGILLLLAGLFDLLDGAVARATKQVTLFGGLMDSVVDRLSEAALFFGLLVSYAPWENTRLEVWLLFLAMVGSLMVSYVRARSEGLGLECKVGILTRAERIVILSLGLLLNQMVIALALLALLTFATVVQRLLFVRRQSGNRQSVVNEKEGK